MLNLTDSQPFRFAAWFLIALLSLWSFVPTGMMRKGSASGTGLMRICTAHGAMMIQRGGGEIGKSASGKQAPLQATHGNCLCCGISSCSGAPCPVFFLGFFLALIGFLAWPLRKRLAAKNGLLACFARAPPYDLIGIKA